jgi:hypothetical protein
MSKTKPADVEVIVVKPQIPRGSKVAPPRLRFDRVVLRVFRDLRAALEDAVPSGVTVVVTLTAPIRLASKTTAAIEAYVRKLLEKRSSRAPATRTIEANEVRIQVIRGDETATSALIGFVHNRDSDPTVLFRLTRALLQCAQSITPESRVLRVEMHDEPRWIKTYAHVCAGVFAPSGFERILLVGADGKEVPVESIAP